MSNNSIPRLMFASLMCLSGLNSASAQQVTQNKEDILKNTTSYRSAVQEIEIFKGILDNKSKNPQIAKLKLKSDDEFLFFFDKYSDEEVKNFLRITTPKSKTKSLELMFEKSELNTLSRHERDQLRSIWNDCLKRIQDKENPIA